MSSSVGSSFGGGRRTPVILLILLAVSVALNLALAVLVMTRTSSASDTPSFDAKKFYVVNLADNESFVGHVHDMTTLQLTLTDVYNLSVQSPATASPAPGATPSPQPLNPVICKLGTTGCKQLTGLYGNKDTLYITRQNVEYISELPVTSKVVQAIQDYEKKNPPGH